MEEGRRPGEQGCRGGGHPNHRRPLAEPLQPRAPARVVAGWCCDQCPAILVGNREFPRTYTQQNAGNKIGEETQSQWPGEGECRMDYRARWTHLSNQGPR